MRIILTIFWIIIGFLILGLFSLNVGQTVNVNLLFQSYQDVSLVTVTFISLFLGFLLASLIFVVRILKLRHLYNVTRKQLQQTMRQLEEAGGGGSAKEADPSQQKKQLEQPENDDTSNI